jgi:subtilisin family serine protease
MLRRTLVLGCALVATLLVDARIARSDPRVVAAAAARSPVGVGYLQALGRHATTTLAPSSGMIGALVAVPSGQRAEDFGLEPVVPGIARLRGSAARVEAFGLAHPDLRMEIAPPLHPLLDRVGRWVAATSAHQQYGVDGAGVVVGVADTGLDVVHPEFRDSAGRTRVLWMLDLSLKPLGVWPDLEKQFGIKDDSGNMVAGAVLSETMIDDLLTSIQRSTCVESSSKTCAPSDEVGHGTHVAGIAAGTGATGRYPGVASGADIIAVRVARSGENIENDDLVRAVQFMFDRADFEKKPMVANLSLGSDFGPHDGTFLWEKSIAAYVGPDKPGHAIVAAAGNSGSVLETPIHQSVHVTSGARMRVPVHTGGADSGSVQIWVTLRAGADLKVGLDGPDGEWLAPVEQGHQNGKNTSDYNAGVIYGANLDQSPIPEGSRSAVVVWSGRWPSGTYDVTFEGSGMAELYLQGLGDAAEGDRAAFFQYGVREGTINLPATHPAIIGVGCTVNRPKWTAIGGQEVGLQVPCLDDGGSLPGFCKDAAGNATNDRSRDLRDGEMCWFSSAGPTATGVPKPEIAAPGALVVSAMSRGAKPGTPGSVFTNPSCPKTKDGRTDDRCLQVDTTHAIAVGTSMSAPVVSGVVALLLQRDPTLTQDKVVALLQAGAHRFRGEAPFYDQSGPGEVDAIGSLDALDQMEKSPELFLPSLEQSWVTLSADYVAADGSTPLTAILELRTADARHRADLFDAARLLPVVLVDGAPAGTPPALVRHGPGVWVYAWTPPAGLGGSRATFGATFDGAPIVVPRTLPIGTDGWNADYPSAAKGSGCTIGRDGGGGSGGALPLAAVAWFVLIPLRARRSKRGVPTPRRPDRSDTPGPRC